MFLFGCNVTNKTVSVKEIDLYEYKNMHFINVKLNGKMCRLLVDTGASKSLLDISKAKTYDFDILLFNKDKYIGLGGKRDIYIVYGYETEPFHVAFLGTDLSEVTEYFSENHMPIIGVLGVDFLENNQSRIDFKTNKIYFYQ